jgi:osmotically inducible protein OsmC
MIAKTASARWNGNLEEGDGTLRSHTLDHPYSFATRFGEEDGTNPEELIGSALAGCFAMALAHGLDGAGHTPNSIEARTRVELDPDALAIPRIELEVEADVPGLDPEAFREAAFEAKDNCPVSKALAGVTIDLTEARLSGE